MKMSYVLNDVVEWSFVGSTDFIINVALNDKCHNSSKKNVTANDNVTT